MGSEPDVRSLVLDVPEDNPAQILASLQRWLRRKPSFVPRDLLQRFQLTGWVGRRACRLRLVSLFEQRQWLTVFQPFRGQRADPSLLGVEAPPSPVPPPQDFSDRVLSCPHKERGEQRSCERCDGSGEISCGRCGGSGSVTSRSYRQGKWESSRSTCSTCSGSGDVTCWMCAGVGQVWAYPVEHIVHTARSRETALDPTPVPDPWLGEAELLCERLSAPRALSAVLDNLDPAVAEAVRNQTDKERARLPGAAVCRQLLELKHVAITEVRYRLKPRLAGASGSGELELPAVGQLPEVPPSPEDRSLWLVGPERRVYAPELTRWPLWAVALGFLAVTLAGLLLTAALLWLFGRPH